MTNLEAKTILFMTQQANIHTWDKEVLEAMEIGVKAIRDLEDCKSELCLKCGAYQEAHLGACTGCRWKR